MLIFVIGSGLREICGDQSAVGLTFIRAATTAPIYRLYSIGQRFAALVEVAEGGSEICGELCQLSEMDNEKMSTTEPPCVTQKLIKLSDGYLVASATSTLNDLPKDALDITEFGGFAPFIKSTKET